MTWEEMVADAMKEKPRRRPKHEEDDLQMACVRWFDLQYPHLKPLLFHAANEGKCTKAQAGIRKRMGVRAGVADLILLVPRYGYSSLAIEMKTKSGRQSEMQKEWQKIMEEQGGKYIVVRSVEEFINEVKNYLYGSD